jgi:hypothetical protein
MTTVGINAIPVVIWFFEDDSPEVTMILYSIENVAAIILTALFVMLLAKSREKNETGNMISRNELVGNFLLIALGTTIISSIFLFAFILGILKTQVTGAAIEYGVLGITAFQLVGFFFNLILLRPLSISRAEELLTEVLGRVFLLVLCLFIGVFVALFVDKWFVIPFIILKTIIDFGGLIQSFTGNGDKNTKKFLFRPAPKKTFTARIRNRKY